MFFLQVENIPPPVYDLGMGLQTHCCHTVRMAWKSLVLPTFLVGMGSHDYYKSFNYLTGFIVFYA